MDQTILQVSDLLAIINQTLEYAYPSVTVEGEVASFKVSKGKFVFFDLKDDSGVVNCFMMIYGLRQPLEDGMRVQVVAQPRLTNWGKFSLTVREVRSVGEGSIKRAFELLLAKLQKEGMFDKQRKRHLPVMPERVGLITSIESAGYADFVKILNQRWGGVEVVVADVQVQGSVAAQQMINAISYFNQMAEPPEVLVFLRGGGSAEDLAIFNDEYLTRAVASSRVPTLAGVGHETDTTLVDLVVDVRAATPSNAAQILVPDKTQLAREIQQKQKRLADQVQSSINQIRIVVNQVAQKMVKEMESALAQHYQRVQQVELLLRQLDPKVALNRGYSLVRTKRGKIVKSVGDVEVGESLKIEVSQATITAGVIDVTKK